MRAQFIYEKFTQDTDPLKDMQIGINNPKMIYKLCKEIVDKLKKFGCQADYDDINTPEWNKGTEHGKTYSIDIYNGYVDEIIFVESAKRIEKIKKAGIIKKSIVFENPCWILSNLPYKSNLIFNASDIDGVVKTILKKEHPNIDNDIQLLQELKNFLES